MRLSNMNSRHDCNRGRGLHRAAAIGGLLVLGQAAYAATEPAAPEDDTQVMPERVMTLRGKSLRAERVSSATLTNMKTEEVPQTVNVITRDLMDAKGADSLVDALRMDSSVSTGGDMLMSRTADQYTIRGFAGSDVQIGNMPLPRGMGYGMDTSLIENIEVVKGPIGSISGGQTGTLGAYGAGGSINLMLKTPEFVKQTEVTGYARFSESGQKYRMTIDDTRYHGDDENGGYALRTIVAGEYDRPFWLDRGANGGQKYTVSPIFRWQHDSRTKTVLTTSFQYQNSPTYAGIPVLAGHFVGPYDAWYGSPSGRLNSKSLLTMLDFERKLEKIWTIRIGGGLGYSDVDYNLWGVSSGAKGMTTEQYYNQMIASGKAKYEASWSDTQNINWNVYSNALAEFKTGKVAHEALMGVSYTGSSVYGDGSAMDNTDDYFSLHDPAPVTPSDRDYSGAKSQDDILQRAGFLLQDVLAYNQWRFLAGVRGDAHFSLDNTYGFSWSPRFGVTRMFGERVALFANASRTSAPNFGYRDENDKEFTNSWTTDQMEFGFRVSPVDKVWFSASWFDIIQNNTPVTLAPGGPTYTDGSKRAEGVELSLNGEITKNWSSYLSYTYTRTKNRNTGEVYPTLAPNALALWQKYRIDGGVLNGTVLGLGYRCKDSYFATFRGNKIADNYTIPSFSVFDFTVEVPLPETRYLKNAVLRLAVYNIFDEKYVQSMRHAVQCTVGDPRTFEIGLKTTF